MHFDEKLLERKYVWSIPQVHFNEKFISGNVLEENLSIMIIKNKSWQGIGFLSFLGLLEMYVLNYFIYSLWSSFKEIYILGKAGINLSKNVNRPDQGKHCWKGKVRRDSMIAVILVKWKYASWCLAAQIS